MIIPLTEKQGEQIRTAIETGLPVLFEHNPEGPHVILNDHQKDQLKKAMLGLGTPGLTDNRRNLDTALAYLRTLANFGGTIEQARTLAEKAVKELG